MNEPTERELLAKQDAVIGLMTAYMDDLLDRARQVNAAKRNHPDATAGAYAMYAEARLAELVRKVAEAARVEGGDVAWR